MSPREPPLDQDPLIATLVRRNHELSVLNTVAGAIVDVRDLPSLLDEITDRLRDLLNVDAAGICLLDGPDRLANIHFHGCSEAFVLRVRHHGPKTGITGFALSRGRLQMVEEIASNPGLDDPAAVEEGFRSAAALPLESPKGPVGVVAILTRTPRCFTSADLHLFVAVARQLAVAIENYRLYEQARDGEARLRAISEISRAIGSTLEVEGVFRIVAERLQRLIPFRQLSLHIVRANRTELSVRTIERPAPGQPAVVLMGEAIPLADVGPFRQVLKQREVYEEVEEDGPCAYLPVVADNIPLGVLVVRGDTEDQPPGPFRRRDLALLEDLAGQMAISLKNARVFSDLERAYRELSKAKDRLVRAEKFHALGEMAAGVAHDFNNVLSAILGRAQMVKVLTHNDEIQKSLEVIERAALDGAGTVRRIQEFAKAKSDEDLVPVRLNPLVRDALELATSRLNLAIAKIEVLLQLAEVAPILGRPSELREVITNLVYNAVDAMPEGGRLAVRTGLTRKREEAWFEVQDDGVGMDAEIQNRMFDPFFSTKGRQGTGLGMSVSYGIIQRHRGEFTVESARGRGTRIRVTLPIAPEEARLSPNITPIPYPAAGSRSAPPSSDRSPSPAISDAPCDGPASRPPPDPPAEETPMPRILVIDDDVAVRNVLTDILSSEPYDVVAAGNGPEGLALFDDSEFDAVFTDLGMPGMSGWEVARGVKARRPETVVGLITGWGATLDESTVAENGVDVIMAKPFRLEQVLDAVREAMSTRRP